MNQLSILDVKATIILHYFFSLVNPMYVPYAICYYVDRVYIACNLNSACANLSFVNYLTEEIIVMIVSVIIHIPIWSLCLRIVDIKKNGGKIKDLFSRKVESVETLSAEECVGEFEDEDVRIERDRVLDMCAANNSEEISMPIIVKV
jgi:ATP-binding cassette, subfamily A (ABC1), member 5